MLALVGTLAIGITMPSTAFAEDQEIAESFAGRRTVSDNWVGSGNACLTARRSAEGAIAGCNLDEVGSGVLRLTDADLDEVGSVVYDSPVPADAGLDILFYASQWGGENPWGGDTADGISFFLVRGDSAIGQIGSHGSGLGYAPLVDEDIEGVPNALLGVGLDVYGGFGSRYVDGLGCAEAEAAGQDLVLRGPGDGMEGYCYLAGTDEEINLHGDDRESGARLVRIRLDSADTSPRMITVWVAGTQFVRTELPAEFDEVDTVKLGWAASTGAATDYHEIWGVSVLVTPQADDFVYEPPSVEDDAAAIDESESVPETETLPATGKGSGSAIQLAVLLIVSGASLAMVNRRRKHQQVS